MTQELFRPCFIKNGKTECFNSCFTLKKTDNILFEKQKLDNEIKTIITPCNSYLPEFIDKIRCEYQAQKYLKKNYPIKT